MTLISACWWSGWENKPYYSEFNRELEPVSIGDSSEDFYKGEQRNRTIAGGGKGIRKRVFFGVCLYYSSFLLLL